MGEERIAPDFHSCPRPQQSDSVSLQDEGLPVLLHMGTPATAACAC